MSIQNTIIDQVSDAAASRSPRANAFYAGAFIALVVLSGYSLLGITSGFMSKVVPYLAGVGMFAALLAIFGAIIGTLKQVRKTANKQALIWDCYVAISVIGVMGYFLAACVQTFQPGGNPADYWTNGGIAASCFAAIFLGGKYGKDLLAAGKNAK